MSDAIDYGVDVSTFAGPGGAMGLDPTFTPIRGPRVVAEAVARRLVTPAGLLPEDSEYGFDVRGLLNASLTPGQLAAAERAIAAQAEADERALAADVRVTFSAAASTLSVRVALSLATGPFAFVLDVSAARVALLLPENTP